MCSEVALVAVNSVIGAGRAVDTKPFVMVDPVLIDLFDCSATEKIAGSDTRLIF